MQVIAHRANTLTLAEEAWRIGCHFAEVDLFTAPDGQLIVTRDATAGGEPLESFLRHSGGLYLDVKQAHAAAVAEAVRGREATLIWSADNAFLQQLLTLDPSLTVMPQAKSSESLAAAIPALRPRAVAFAAWDYREPLVRQAQRAGARTYVDLLHECDTEEQWAAARALGVDGIMTDRAPALIAWLRRL